MKLATAILLALILLVLILGACLLAWWMAHPVNGAPAQPSKFWQYQRSHQPKEQ